MHDDVRCTIPRDKGTCTDLPCMIAGISVLRSSIPCAIDQPTVGAARFHLVMDAHRLIHGQPIVQRVWRTKYHEPIHEARDEPTSPW